MYHPDIRIVYRLVTIISFFIFAFTMAGCGGRPFDVKARPDNPPLAGPTVAAANGVTIQAEAITDEDFLNDNFDANLILAGILPVRARIRNEGQELLDFKKSKFEVKPNEGRNFKLINAKAAFKQLISYYEITTYSEDGYKESRAAFSSYEFDISKPLASGETREGILFFKMAGNDVRGMNLTLIAGLAGAGRAKNAPVIELKLK